MCGGGGGGGVSEQLAVQSANQEQARQDRISQGMREIELMFNGGRRTTGQVGSGAKYDRNATYYNRDGSVWQPNQQRIATKQQQNGGMSGAVGGGWSGAASPENQIYTDPSAPKMGERPNDLMSRAAGLDVQWDQQQDAMRQRSEDEAYDEEFQQGMAGGLYTGVEDMEGYGDAFYDKAYKAQLDYAMPQVDRQFQDAQRELQFALARQGLSASSQAGQLQADLARQRDLAIQGEQDKANTVRQKQRSAVEEERSNLTQMLQQTGDVGSTLNAAAARKGIIESAPAIEEVGPLFQNSTGALADMIVSPAMRQAGQNSGGGGYGARKGSGKVVA